jgi:hypothetical protein
VIFILEILMAKNDMEWELLNIKMEMFIMENSKMAIGMDKESWFIQMERKFKENS